MISALIEIHEQIKLDGNLFDRGLFIKTKQNFGNLDLPYEDALDIEDEIGDSLFQDTTGEINDLRKRILLNLVMFIEPEWMPFSNYKGRDQIKKNIEETENSTIIYQSFDDANLFSEDSYETDIWWAVVQSKAYSENLTEVINGVKGEDLSMRYERRKLKNQGLTGYEPKKISTKNSMAGYDIESWEKIDEEEPKKIFIEVKFTERNYVRFFLSRNEFDTAEKFKNDYLIHFWQDDQVDTEEPTPTREFSFEWLKNNVPEDHGCHSYWNKVLIDEGIKK